MKRWNQGPVLPLLLAAALALAGCQGPPSTELSSIPMTPDAKAEAGEPPAPEEPSSQSQPAPEPEPQPPEPEYTDWVLGEWTTEPQEENDLCRLANTKTQETQTWGPWSEWSVEPVEETNAKQVEIKEDYVYEKTAELIDKHGYRTGEFTWRKKPSYIYDDYGMIVGVEYETQTYYRYRDLATPATATLYQYKTRQITNQAELDNWKSQFYGE